MSDPETMKDIFDPLVEKHFTAAELNALQSRPKTWDQNAVSAEWDSLIADCKALMAKGDPTSPAAMELARRWMAQVGQFTQGDPKMFAKAGAMWKDAMNDPSAAAKLPLTPDMFAFIGKADRARKAQE